jgi:hypothetical protein
MRAGLLHALVVIAGLMVTGGGLAWADEGRASGGSTRPADTAPGFVYLQNLVKQVSPTADKVVSGVQVQNLDATQVAAARATFATAAGALTTLELPPIPPLGAYNFYLPTEARLAEGWYAAAIDGDRRLAAISRTEWLATGGAAMFSDSIPAKDIVLPLLVRHYAGQSSVVRIQNIDPAQTTEAVLRVYASGLGEVAVIHRTIPPAGFVTLDMADSTVDFGRLLPSFAGWLHVASVTALAVSSYVAYDNGSRAVYGFEGVPLELAANKLYAPLVRNAYYGTTGISVVNPMPAPARVTVRYVGANTLDYGRCVGQTYTQGPVTIGAGSIALFYQANVSMPGTGISPLPSGCAGSATVESADGPVLAVVNDATGNSAQPSSAAAYNAVTAAQGARRVALPLYRNRHTRAQLTTGIQAMNIGDAAAHVEITFALADGRMISGAACGSACHAVIAPGAAYVWFPAGIPALPDAVYGSAFIASDQPLAVIVNDASLTGALDAAIYNGIKADEVEPGTP